MRDDDGGTLKTLVRHEENTRRRGFRKAGARGTPNAAGEALTARCREIDCDTAIVQFPNIDTGRNRRKSLRKPLKLRVELEGAHGRADQTRDIGIGGMFVETDRLRAVGSRVRARLWLPGGSQEVLGTVRWIRPLPSGDRSGRHHRGMGLKFLGMSPGRRKALADILRL